MPLTQLSAPLSREQAMALVDAVMEREGLALAASAHEMLGGEWLFEAICDRSPDLAAIAALALEVLGGAVAFRAAPIPETDWVRKSLEGLQPVAAGLLYVHGSHNREAPPPGHIPILIDAGQAFGTGHHASTFTCLEALDLTLRTADPRRVLDLGCGSGILAIAAAKVLRCPALATDIDPVAVAVTLENARANGVGALVSARVADGLTHRKIAESGPYDLIMANILAEPLRKMALALSRHAARGATVILGGFLENQASRLVAAYAEHGFVQKKKAARDGWATLTLQRMNRV
ncbi:MAG: 50S ribosomal protein L11 methyltransferase [Cucumibacter sp.]